MNDIRKLAKTLPVVNGVKTPWFVRDSDQILRISTERSNSYKFADYYGEGRGGYPWIHSSLEEWAEANHGFWEWENPSNIAFYSQDWHQH
jgi:hypothetical protein